MRSYEMKEIAIKGRSKMMGIPERILAISEDIDEQWAAIQQIIAPIKRQGFAPGGRIVHAAGSLDEVLTFTGPPLDDVIRADAHKIRHLNFHYLKQGFFNYEYTHAAIEVFGQFDLILTDNLKAPLKDARVISNCKYANELRVEYPLIVLGGKFGVKAICQVLQKDEVIDDSTLGVFESSKDKPKEVFEEPVFVRGIPVFFVRVPQTENYAEGAPNESKLVKNWLRAVERLEVLLDQELLLRR